MTGAGGPTPLLLAQAMRLEGRAPDDSAAHLVLRAAEPWSPGTHGLFPAAVRARVVDLMLLGHSLSHEARFQGSEAAIFDLWMGLVVPLAIHRDAARLPRSFRKRRLSVAGSECDVCHRKEECDCCDCCTCGEHAAWVRGYCHCRHVAGCPKRLPSTTTWLSAGAPNTLEGSWRSGDEQRDALQNLLRHLAGDCIELNLPSEEEHEVPSELLTRWCLRFDGAVAQAYYWLDNAGAAEGGIRLCGPLGDGDHAEWESDYSFGYDYVGNICVEP
eukprot:7385643-Prymnesium_polylepis.1